VRRGQQNVHWCGGSSCCAKQGIQKSAYTLNHQTSTHESNSQEVINELVNVFKKNIWYSTSQPTPRLSTEGGICVAPPNLDAAMNVPVDCYNRLKRVKWISQYSQMETKKLNIYLLLRNSQITICRYKKEHDCSQFTHNFCNSKCLVHNAMLIMAHFVIYKILLLWSLYPKMYNNDPHTR